MSGPILITVGNLLRKTHNRLPLRRRRSTRHEAMAYTTNRSDQLLPQRPRLGAGDESNLQRRLLPHLRDSKLDGNSVFVRELMPQDRKIEVEQLTSEDAIAVAGFLAAVVGKAHGRQMDAGIRKEWQHELQPRPVQIPERAELAMDEPRRVVGRP